MTGRRLSRTYSRKPTLEDYILDMETRPPEKTMDTNSGNGGVGGVANTNGNGSITNTDQSLWEQLQKKDEDLLLAAELGKALLEKNEDLTKMHERTVEEYSTKLEVSVVCCVLCFVITIVEWNRKVGISAVRSVCVPMKRSQLVQTCASYCVCENMYIAKQKHAKRKSLRRLINER